MEQYIAVVTKTMNHSKTLVGGSNELVIQLIVSKAHGKIAM